jgi:hypothetical protein
MSVISHKVKEESTFNPQIGDGTVIWSDTAQRRNAGRIGLLSFYENSSAHDAESPDELVSSDVKPPFGRVNDGLGPITNDYLHFIDCRQPAASLADEISFDREIDFQRGVRQVTVTWLC